MATRACLLTFPYQDEKTTMYAGDAFLSNNDHSGDSRLVITESVSNRTTLTRFMPKSCPPNCVGVMFATSVVYIYI